MSNQSFHAFSINHEFQKIKAPYVRVADRKTGAHGDVIIKYDVRFKQPNKEHMDINRDTHPAVQES